MADFDLYQIGVVESPVSDRRLMSTQGVPAKIHVFPEYADGLYLIDANSHLWITGWLEDADRERLQIVRPNYPPSVRRRGIFGLRSTTRPNSLFSTPARLLSVSGTTLSLEALDLVDGTPIVDIKRYAATNDIVFSARGPHDRYVPDKNDATWLSELEAEAGHFLGAISGPVIAGARLVQHVSLAWGIMPKDAELRLAFGSDLQSALVIDAVQALTGATFGSGRLRATGEPGVHFEMQSRRLDALPLACVQTERENLRRRPFDELFEIHSNEE